MELKNKFNLTTPVLFLVFNRPDTTKKVFEEIKKAKPKQLFIAADGPRTQEEKKKTDTIRKYILDNINWRCKVKTLFRDENLGCKYAVSSAIDWFFENVEKGIILEDDCLPNQSFFRFCQEILEKYKENERIMQINGTNIEGKSRIKKDYFFSNCFNIWGWATWKRAWKKYDVDMKEWEKYNSLNGLKKLGYSKLITRLGALRIFNLTHKGEIDTWDYQWDFACRLNNGLCIVPRTNLITNIGFGGDGTHTNNYGKEKTIERREMIFPLSENKIIVNSLDYGKKYKLFFGKGILKRYLKKILNKLISFSSY